MPLGIWASFLQLYSSYKVSFDIWNAQVPSECLAIKTFSKYKQSWKITHQSIGQANKHLLLIKKFSSVYYKNLIKSKELWNITIY